MTVLAKAQAEEGEIVCRMPEGLEYAGEVMSNFDHEVDKEVAKKIQDGGYYASYPAWNFHGVVWYDKTESMYRCEVWTYRQYQKTVSGTLIEIMEKVSEEFGYE